MGQKTYKKTILSDFNEDYKKKIGAEVARLMKEKRIIIKQKKGIYD